MTNAVNPRRDDPVFDFLVRAALVLAAVCLIIGGGIYLHQYGWQLTHYADFRQKPDGFFGFQQILRRGFSGQGEGIIQLGILLLILNPVLRVVMAIASFVRQRDYLYIGIGLLVLGILMFSMFVGTR